jgi:endonuclease YncB( thermonuclease family)
MSWEDSPDYGSQITTPGAIITTVAAVVLSAGFAFACAAMSSVQNTRGVKSIYWSDGDSGRIDEIEFRLADWDAPETGAVGSRGGAKCEGERALGFKAKEFMVELTREGGVSISRAYDVDRYGRQVLDLAVNDEDIAQVGKRAGHLRSWRHVGSRAVEPKPDWCS